VNHVPQDLPAPGGLHGTAHGTAHAPIATAQPRGRVPRILWLVPVLAAGVLAYGAKGYLEREARALETQHETATFVPNVRAVAIRRTDAPMRVTLPGATEAFEQATIRARATGYIAGRNVDIGTRVRTGDLLARIEAPELAQQLAQGEATLGQTEAALEQARARMLQARNEVELAVLNNRRTSSLADTGVTSRQSADTNRFSLASRAAELTNASAGVDVAQANLRAQQASVLRLRQLLSFTRITAPFDGVITSRSVDNGDLVNADNAAAALFTLVRDDILRVRINIPQSEAAGITEGLAAAVTVAELPGRRFEGRVARSAVALSGASRTLATEVDVPNPDRVLRPGMFVQVQIDVPRPTPVVVVPSEALVFNGQGMGVLTVDAAGAVQRKAVTIRRDFGLTVELASGLDGNETILLSAPAGLNNGDLVRPVLPRETRPAAPAPGTAGRS
jgi:RND family efflux transporter MFP subunit